MRIVGGFVLMAAMALAWFLTVGQPEGAKLAYVGPDHELISNAIKTYVINAGRPPTTAQGLDALVNEPKSGPKPRRWIQVWKKLPTDPWGTPYRYTLLAPQDGEWRWELRGAGPDGTFGSSDDQVNEGEMGTIDVLAELPEEKVGPRPTY